MSPKIRCNLSNAAVVSVISTRYDPLPTLIRTYLDSLASGSSMITAIPRHSDRYHV